VYSLTARAEARSGVAAVRRAVVRLGARADRSASIVAWFRESAGDDARVPGEASEGGDGREAP
jgi:hypothetical protein